LETIGLLPKYVQFAVQYAALLLCISVHESAHALAAHLLGDDTAKNQGRISLNPIAHIDIFGTFIFPILAFIWSIPLIGWAKPVMVNSQNLRDSKRDDIFIAAAGPVANLATAFILLIFFNFIIPLEKSNPPIFAFYFFAIYINILLALFNMIPIPPLDGSGVLRGFLPEKWVEKYDSIRGFGFILIYLLLLTGIIDVFLVLAQKLFYALKIAAIIPLS
jgi:Zn-dependent protease